MVVGLYEREPGAACMGPDPLELSAFTTKPLQQCVAGCVSACEKPCSGALHWSVCSSRLFGVKRQIASGSIVPDGDAMQSIPSPTLDDPQSAHQACLAIGLVMRA